ncbi:MAG: bifunctional UDP-N-acetylglucosamine diphosphorylase/glucosamine-1-phosphate N-acetyltransferase GlmU [Peptococcaceae bacterium]|nr:bifunctional UDP-N-acetylglucosamine diphosphorylase/glucosamine-1-phosphate N-acetyltransferase GlmU [Peptococcaceae bacterium]
MRTTAIILAAGQGTRMKSKLPKVLHRVLGKPMVQWVIDCLTAAGVTDKITVLGHGAEQVATVVGEQTSIVYQTEQLGTGHAVMQGVKALGAENDCVIVICGDTPLLQADTIKSLLAKHNAEKNMVTVLTAQASDPTGYGRIVRNGAQIEAIVEQKDATEEEKTITEINTGTYCFNQQFLLQYLPTLTTNNAQKEYYLTDLIKIANQNQFPVGGYQLDDFSESLGVNNRVQLAQAEQVLRQRKCNEVMLAGVTLIDPASTYIGADVVIGNDTIIYPNVVLEGATVIGSDNVIGMNCRFVDSIIGDNNDIQSTTIVESTVGNGCKIGPMAYLRPGTVLADQVKIGDFVELKKSQIGTGTKIPHLSYVGDAVVGSSVNIGCGTITCNYDGVNKYQTTIKDNAFIGSNTNLVAPVVVEEKAFIGAGSTITKDVPADTLAVVRGELRLKDDWSKRQALKKKK